MCSRKAIEKKINNFTQAQAFNLNNKKNTSTVKY